MIRLDKVRLSFEGSIFFNVNHDKLRKITESDPEEGFELKKYEVKKDKAESLGIIGLNYLFINPIDYSGEIQFSSKILEENYYKLITQETIHEIIERIELKGLVSIDPDLMLNAGVCSMEVTDDIFPQYDVDECLNALDCLITSKRIEIRRKRCGLTKIRGIYDSNSLYLKFYNKYKELMKKRNSYLRSLIPLNYFKGDLRIESYINDWDYIKTLFNLLYEGQPIFKDILYSKERINYKLFQLISLHTAEIVDHAPGSHSLKTLGDFKNELFIKQLVNETKGNWNNAKKILKQFSIHAYKLNDYQRMFVTEYSRKHPAENKIIKEIERLLFENYDK